MRFAPPPLPGPQPPPTVLRPMLLQIVGVVALALGSVVLGAFALPALRRSQPAESVPDTSAVVRVGDSASTPVLVRKNHSSEADATKPDPSAAAEPTTRAERPAAKFDMPTVVPQLPSRTGPYAVTLLIDREIDAKLKAASVSPSPLSGDAEFVRRAHLDIIGRVPSYGRTVAFLADPDPLKRSKLIDELLASDGYGKHFARLWADALIKRDFDSNRGLETAAFTGWLAERFNQNLGWDQIVREMVTAEGSENSSPATLFVTANMDNRQPSPSKLTGAVGNLFMGIQIQCAECHKHPFVEKWDVNDFWGVAAFFAHTRAQRSGPAKNKKGQGPARITEVEQSGAVKDKKGKPLAAAVQAGLVIKVPDPNDPRKTIRNARGKFFMSSQTPPAARAPYRPMLAKWLTSSNNRFFAPAAVNRLWSHFFARGLVHPIEDMSDQNKPTHPELLGELAAAFTASRHSLKDLIRAVCNSQAYQRTSRPLPENANDDRLLSHLPVKVLDAKQLIDSLQVVTGREVRLPRQAAPGRNVRDAGDPTVRALDTRDYDDDATEFTLGIPQMLKLMNTSLTAASADKATQLAKQHGGNHAAAIETVFVSVLARRPTAAEFLRMKAYVAKQSEPAKGYAGVYWALLNCAEFVSNH